MIKRETNEYREDNLAVSVTTVLFLGIPIYKNINTTTNNTVVEQLTTVKKQKRIKIKGFVK